jgi:DNA-binding beta-propeller fold protein YncE
MEDVMRISRALVSVVLLLLAVTPPRAAAAEDTGYKVVSRMAVAGEGGWDCLTVDPAARRLYVSRSTHVQVVDLDQGKVVGDIPGTAGVHDIALAPDLGRGFTSNGRDSSVTIFDLKTLATLATVKIPAGNPDAILYEPVTKRVFTMNGGSADATAIDAATGAVAGTVKLAGRPEFAVADGRGRVYVNLEDSSLVTAFNARTLRVEYRWSLAPGEGPSGLAMDREHRRLFSVCANKKMIVLDAESGRVMADLPIGERVDGAAFDSSSQLAFSSNGEGTLTVVHEDALDKFSVVGEAATQIGARTVALDPVSHRLYLPTATFGETPAATPDNPRPRPKVIPGTFVILVVGR